MNLDVIYLQLHFGMYIVRFLAKSLLHKVSEIASNCIISKLTKFKNAQKIFNTQAIYQTKVIHMIP